MTDSATSRYKARQQSQGSNTNSWGDDKLNEALRLYDRGSKGVQSLAITGDTVVSWTNYIATNDAQCAVLLLTGSLSAAASLTVPSVEWQWDVIKNSTGQIITVKTASGTGVAIPNGRQVSVYCDASDCYNGTGGNIPTAATIAGSVTVAGIISGVTAGVVATDAVNKTQMETAIANVSGSPTAGTILNSSGDTTAGYLSQKLAVSGALSVTTLNSGANEQAQIALAAASALVPGSMTAAHFSIVSSVTAYIQTLLDDADAATARATLGMNDMQRRNFSEVYC